MSGWVSIKFNNAFAFPDPEPPIINIPQPANIGPQDVPLKRPLKILFDRPGNVPI